METNAIKQEMTRKGKKNKRTLTVALPFVSLKAPLHNTNLSFRGGSSCIRPSLFLLKRLQM